VGLGVAGYLHWRGPKAASDDPPAPDLGSELFPDAAGHPLALAADAPVTIYPRTAWTPTKPDLRRMHVMNGVQRITIHHSGMKTWEAEGWSPTMAEIEAIREFHTGTAPKERGWADIAYHFIVDRAGRVWQARPLVYEGAHVKGHNPHNVGIVLLGNFDQQRPSAVQLTAVTDFILFLRGLYRVPAGQVFTHGELGQTECPGKMLQAYMDRLRSTWT